MKQDLFGRNIHYGNVEPMYVLIGLLSRFDNRFQLASDEAIPELTWKQMYFLNSISMFDEPPSIRDMANFMGSSHQTANRICAKLIGNGYIISKQDNVDKRKQRLFLTKKGEFFLSESAAVYEKNVNELFSVLSDEDVENTIDIFARLDGRLTEISGKSGV